MKDWGLLPEDVRQQLRQKEWEHPRHLRQRLLGERTFPIRINLHPPTGKQVLDDVAGFHSFVGVWRSWPLQTQLEWKQTRYAQLGQQDIPSTLIIGSIQELIECLGDSAAKRSRQWQSLMAPILEVDQSLYPVLIKQLHRLEKLTVIEATMIAQLLPQLTQGMGCGCYLRALPIDGVDTKFLEMNQLLITQLLDELYKGGVSRSGGLFNWLNCAATPSDWLWVRPLCAVVQQALGGISVMRLPTEVLKATPLPGERIIVVENEQSGYALPELAGTVAIFGGGRNLAWMEAGWLQQKRVGYWGDMDTWGFLFLSEARQRRPHITSVLMDRETLLLHQERMVEEPEPYSGSPENLTEAESQLYLELRDGVHGNTRLEQERISADHILARLGNWMASK